MTLKEIKAPVEKHIEAFESHFRNAMKSKVPLLDKITHYIVKRKGKQLRPLFVFLSAEIFGSVTEKTYRAASLIELLHTATLIHDDVVDDSNERRGFFSLNALWKNKISVLVGDYFLSKGLLLSVGNDDFDLLKIVAHSVKQMIEGELMQIEKARNLDVDEALYFDVIRKKTASLIASCLSCGAASLSASEEHISLMHDIGEKAGMAFQMKDDIMDFEPGTAKGKPTGSDIRDRNLTLPLIFVIRQASYTERRRIINTVKNHSHDPEKVAWLIDLVRARGGIDHAREHMELFKDQAAEMLHTLPDVPARHSLMQLIEFTIDRDY